VSLFVSNVIRFGLNSWGVEIWRRSKCL